MLHEEMFDIQGLFSRQELYQLWINLPASEKMKEPTTTLLRSSGNEDVATAAVDSGAVVAHTPVVTTTSGQRVVVLAGTYQGHTAETPIVTPMTILHVTLAANQPWQYDLPMDYETMVVYLRRGNLVVGSTDNDNESASNNVPAHHTVYLRRPPSLTSGDDSLCGAALSVTAGSRGADFLLLAGAPIREPCVAQGSMVMDSSRGIQQAYLDYERGLFGKPWDHALSNAEWKRHVQTHPSQY